MMSVCILTIKTREQVQNYIDEALNNATGDFEFVFVSNSNGGVSLNRNACLRQAKGDIIIFCDDDLYGYPKGWNQELIKPLIEDKNVLITGARLLNPDGNLQNTISKTNDIRQDYIKVPYLPGACFAYKRNSLWFDENYKGWGMDDVKFAIELKRLNPQGYFILCNTVKLNHINEMKNESKTGRENKQKFIAEFGFLIE